MILEKKKLTDIGSFDLSRIWIDSDFNFSNGYLDSRYRD